VLQRSSSGGRLHDFARDPSCWSRQTYFWIWRIEFVQSQDDPGVVVRTLIGECNQPDVARTRAVADMLAGVDLAGAHPRHQPMERIGLALADPTHGNPLASVNTSFRGEKTLVREGDGRVRTVGRRSLQGLHFPLIEKRGEPGAGGLVR
jgi:hypothetical protein